MIIIGYLQENSGHSSKLAKASLWSDNVALPSSSKKNSSAMAKKSNIGIKINARLQQNKTSTTENAVSPDKETVAHSDKIPNTSTSTSNTGKPENKSDNVGNGLLLLGAYSDSSDDDSD